MASSIDVYTPERLKEVLAGVRSSKRSGSERYDIRLGKHDAWAIFTIGTDGQFSCHSDYGDYNYWWSSIGSCTFKQFIVTLRDPDYLLGKVTGGRRTFNLRRTLQSWRDDIVEARKDQRITKDQARRLYDELDEDSAGEYYCTADLLQHHWHNNVFTGNDPESQRLYDRFSDLSPIYEYSYQERFWATVLFPAFQRVIATELEHDPRYTPLQMILPFDDKR